MKYRPAMNEDQKNLTEMENKTTTETNVSESNLKTFESNGGDKKLIAGCVLSAVVSVLTVFVIMKVGLNYHEEKIQAIAENYASLDTRIKSVVESIADLNSSIESLKLEWKDAKEHSSYLYTNLSALQKDVSIIKEKLGITEGNSNDITKKLSSEKGTFIESLDNLVKEGAPFDTVLESYREKIDMKEYSTSEILVKYANQNTKSLAELKKDFASVGYDIFKTNFEESFWEKQKRIIKEKISEAIKIRKNDESENSVDYSSLSDKEKFEKAGNLLSDQKYAESIKILSSLKIDNEDLGLLITNIKKRQGLEEAFSEFKKEFMEIEENRKEK